MPKIVLEGQLREDDIASTWGRTELTVKDVALNQVIPAISQGVCIGVAIKSYDETRAHPLIKSLIGRPIRVTIEFASPLDQLSEV